MGGMELLLFAMEVVEPLLLLSRIWITGLHDFGCLWIYVNFTGDRRGSWDFYFLTFFENQNGENLFAGFEYNIFIIEQNGYRSTIRLLLENFTILLGIDVREVSQWIKGGKISIDSRLQGIFVVRENINKTTIFSDLFTEAERVS